MSQKLLGKEHPNVAASLDNVGITYGALGNHREALNYKIQALEMKQKLLGEEHPDVARCLNSVRNTYEALGNHWGFVRKG